MYFGKKTEEGLCLLGVFLYSKLQAPMEVRHIFEMPEMLASKEYENRNYWERAVLTSDSLDPESLLINLN